MSMENTTSPTVAEIGKALAAAQGEMSGAKKDSTNPFFKSKYADLAAVVGAIREPLSKHGIAHVQIPGSDGDGFYVDTMLIHSSGEWIKGRIRMNPVREDPQGIGSVITYMRRYALQAMAGLEAEDDDGNKASQPDTGSSRPATKPLTAGSYQQAKTVPTPTAKAPEARPHDASSDGVTNWRDVICHLGTEGGRVRGKKLVNLTQTSIDWYEKKLADIKEPTQADNLLKAALAMRDAELKPSAAQPELGTSTPNQDALREWCASQKIDLDVITKVSRNLGGSSKTFDEIPEDKCGFMLANKSDTLEGVKFETDNIPM